MELKDRIRNLRISSHMTQKDLGDRVNVSVVTVQNWESGAKTPSTKAIIAMCEIFSVTSDELLGIRFSNDRIMEDYSVKERRLIDIYRCLDPIGKKAVDSLCRIESARREYSQRMAVPMRFIKKYYTPAAAGTAAPIDGEDYEMIPADDAPAGAVFAVGIQGNSMYPIIEDGDTVYVSGDTELVNGDIGIFCVDGAMYCKQLYLDGSENITLVSANPELRHTNVYIGADSGSSFTACGKVLTGRRYDLPSYLTEE